MAWTRLHHNLVWPLLPLAWTPLAVIGLAFVRPDWHATSWLMVGYLALGIIVCAGLSVRPLSLVGIFVGDAGVRVRTQRHAFTIAWHDIGYAEIAMVPTPRGPYTALVVVGPAGEVLLLPVRMGAVTRPWRRGRSQELCFSHRALSRIVARINELAAHHNRRPLSAGQP